MFKAAESSQLTYRVGNSSMLHRCAVGLLLLVVCVSNAVVALGDGVANVQAAKQNDPGWTRLFDGKSLRGWYVLLPGKKQNEDPEKYFQVRDGVVHVYADQVGGTAVTNGVLVTDVEYSYYHFRMEYKWGEKRYKPRAQGKRDAGLLYHVRPPDLVWPRSIECQIQEGDTGDCFTVRGTRLTTSIEMAKIESPSGQRMLQRYKPIGDGGMVRTIGDGGIARIVKSKTAERDGWNRVEVIVRGSESVEHIVNGQTVFRAKDLHELSTPASAKPVSKKDAEKQEWVPLQQGRIALQCEYAEVLYRRMEINKIEGGPFE
jgi:hypothetical protein